MDGVAISAALLMMLGAIIGKVVTAQMINRVKQEAREVETARAQGSPRVAAAAAQGCVFRGSRTSHFAPAY